MLSLVDNGMRAKISCPASMRGFAYVIASDRPPRALHCANRRSWRHHRSAETRTFTTLGATATAPVDKRLRSGPLRSIRSRCSSRRHGPIVATTGVMSSWRRLSSGVGVFVTRVRLASCHCRSSRCRAAAAGYDSVIEKGRSVRMSPGCTGPIEMRWPLLDRYTRIGGRGACSLRPRTRFWIAPRSVAKRWPNSWTGKEKLPHPSVRRPGPCMLKDLLEGRMRHPPTSLAAAPASTCTSHSRVRSGGFTRLVPPKVIASGRTVAIPTVSLAGPCADKHGGIIGPRAAQCVRLRGLRHDDAGREPSRLGWNDHGAFHTEPASVHRWVLADLSG